ncbi:MAG: TolC family protein, partial [Candidatus Aminicenantes bacterium]|nr:TolC family protein [Candidatus Aminicenantes bacterium]
LAIERLVPEMDVLSLKAIRENYLPLFALTYSNSDTNNPGTWGVEGSNIRQKYDNLSFNVTQRFAWGTSIGATLYSRMTDTTRAYSLINPSYNSTFQFNLTQPLLRGFGDKAANVEAIKAARTIQIADASLRATAFQTIYQVEEAYWGLVAARENLKVQESSLAGSRDLLARTRAGARIGTESGVEVLNAETEVARYEDAVLSAARIIQSREDQLKKLLNFPAGDGERLVPLDQPTVELRNVSAEEILRIALDNRPEMETARRRAENSRTDVDYYRNQSLPRLDLSLQFWALGVSGVKYVYQDNNPLTGIVIDKIVGGRGESFSDILKGKYKNWSVNLTLEVPLWGMLSRSGLARSKAAEEQARLQMEKQKRDIEFEVQDIVRELAAKARIIASSTRYRELAEKQVASETQRYQQGLVGSEWLFKYRQDLANARSAEIQAVVDYRIALARLDRIRGTSPALASAGIGN